MVRVMSESLQCIKSESDDELEENEEFAPTPGSESPEPEEPPAAKRQQLEEYSPRVSLGVFGMAASTVDLSFWQHPQ